MLFEKKQQIAIFVIAVTLVMVFVLFWYLPSYKRLKTLKRVRTEQILAVNRAKHLSQELPALNARLIKLQKATADYEQQIPDDRGLGEFLHRIANLMDENNLEDQQIRPGEEIKTGDMYCISVDMKCKGGLSQLFEFYKSLQSFERLVRIEQVKLVNDSGFNGQLSMQTKASIYYRTKAERG